MKCKICNVPLTGFLGKAARIIFKIEPSAKDEEICNKCIEKDNSLNTVAQTPEKKYNCEICNRFISEEHALVHVKTEEYLLKLIKKDHPAWSGKSPLCKECVEYYRKLIKDGEI